MPKYNSLFASPESVQEKWGLDKNEAKKVYELWELAYDEVQNTPKPNEQPLQELTKDSQKYLKEKPGVFDNPDERLTQVKVSISQDQWTRLVNTYGVILLMRSLGTGGDDKRKMFSTMWSGIKGKEKGDVDAAKRTAKIFNDTYGTDEFLNYLQHLAGKTKNVLAQKPYVVPAGQDKSNLYVWHKR